MKKGFALVITLLFALCVQAQDAKTSYFGAKINANKAISAKELTKKMSNKDSLVTKVTAEVESVCQVKGCWMKVKTEDGKTMRVTFKDYGFFVPKDIAGKTVVFEGKAFVKETSIKDLKHFAEDAGKSKEEIAKINKPEKGLTFIADGVIVKR